MNKSTLKKCPYCGGKGSVGIVKYLPVSKMVKLMKKYELTQTKVAALCGISQGGVSDWFATHKNTKGIKEDYFNILAKKGYK